MAVPARRLSSRHQRPSLVQPCRPGKRILAIENRSMNILTVSMASPSAAAFFFSLALTLAVVDSTATATFETASFLGGFIAGGYANKLGLAFETNSNRGG